LRQAFIGVVRRDKRKGSRANEEATRSTKKFPHDDIPEYTKHGKNGDNVHDANFEGKRVQTSTKKKVEDDLR